MQTMQLDNGVLNNYAVEPQAYYAVPPSPEQAKRYLQQGALALLLVTSLVLVALGVS